MKKLTQEELNEIARKHENWLNGVGVDSRQSASFNDVIIDRLSFENMDLSKCEFINSTIRNCDIHNASFSQSVFTQCEIYKSNFINVKMKEAYFKKSFMEDCIILNSNACKVISAESVFSNVKFTNADIFDSTWKMCSLDGVVFENTKSMCSTFKKSDLLSASFKNCNMASSMSFEGVFLDDPMFSNMMMPGTVFSMCRIRDITIEKSELMGSVFRLDSLLCGKFKDTNFNSADFDNCDVDSITIENCKYFVFHGICPETGSFIGYKQAESYGNENCLDYTHCIIEMEIPDSAKRISTSSRLCRADVVLVRHIWPIIITDDGRKAIDFTEDLASARSIYRSDFVYTSGERAKSEVFCDNPFTSGPGIHFLLTKDEALNYYDL